MGRYIDWKDVTNRYQQAATFAGGADEMDSAYIQYAEGEVEGALSGLYAVPFSSNNLTAKDLCIDLTFAKALMFKDAKKAKAIGESVDRRIMKLRNQEIGMAVTSGSPMFAADAAWSNTEDYHPVFAMVDEKNQIVDEDREDDELDDRGWTIP